MTSAALNNPDVRLSADVAMPMLGFGTWQIYGRESYEAVRTALEVGYRHVDTAALYENEAQVGQAVADSGLAREEVFITTKLLHSDAGRARAALEDSLAALGVETVDLYLIHSPPGGASRATGEAPAVNQVKWGPALHDPGFLSESAQRGVVVEGYSPFRSTDLHDGTLRQIAGDHGVTPAQVVLRWHLEHGIVVIPKSVTPERIRANADIFGFSLSGEEVARIDALAG